MLLRRAAAAFLERKSSLQSARRWRSRLLQHCCCAVGTLRTRVLRSRGLVVDRNQTAALHLIYHISAPQLSWKGLNGWMWREVREGREGATGTSGRAECHGFLRFVMAGWPLPGQWVQRGPETALGSLTSISLPSFFTDNFLAVYRFSLRCSSSLRCAFSPSLFLSPCQSSPVPKTPFQQKMPGWECDVGKGCKKARPGRPVDSLGPGFPKLLPLLCLSHNCQQFFKPKL